MVKIAHIWERGPIQLLAEDMTPSYVTILECGHNLREVVSGLSMVTQQINLTSLFRQLHLQDRHVPPL